MAGGEFPFLKSAELCQTRLEVWNKAEFGHVQRSIARIMKNLQWLERQQSSLDIIRAVGDTKRELIERFEEEAMWNQRSHITWLQMGDRNTSFFPSKASSKFQRNHIDGIVDENNCWQEDKAKIVDAFVKYYSDLLTSSQPTKFDEVLKVVQLKVSEVMNKMLTVEFQAAEVSQALKQMYATKAPGPDGMSPLFY